MIEINMSGIDEHYKDCIKQGISTLLENGNFDPALVRSFIRSHLVCLSAHIRE